MQTTSTNLSLSFTFLSFTFTLTQYLPFWYSNRDNCSFQLPDWNPLDLFWFITH